VTVAIKPDILRFMRVLVISDVHANLASLDAVLSEAGDFDVCWSLGDTVGYGPDPGASISRVREITTVGVVGNHDIAAIGNFPLNDFNPMAAEAIRWTRGQLTENEAMYLRAQSDRAVVGDCYMVHGSPRQPVWEYVSDVAVAQHNFEHLKAQWCLVGHTHKPTVFELSQGHCLHLDYQDGDVIELNDRRLMLNPGSVGQPRDGDPRASYAIYDVSAATVTLHRVAYDIQLTQTRMRAAGLPAALSQRLSSGR
jgi:predicted phosphodiesterase